MPAALPDPVETVLLLCDPKVRIPKRARRHLNLPGDNRTRGLVNMTLKSTLESEVRISRATAGTIQSRMTVAAATAPEEDQISQLDPMVSDADCDGSEEDLPEEASMAGSLPANAVANSDADDVRGFHPWPWAPPELLWQELLNMWAGPSSTSVVDFSPGLGSLMLACTKCNIPYTGIAINDAHSKVVMQAACLLATVENLRGTPLRLPISGSKRLLGRSLSLGGGHGEVERASAAITKAVSQSLPSTAGSSAASLASGAASASDCSDSSGED